MLDKTVEAHRAQYAIMNGLTDTREFDKLKMRSHVA